VGNNQITKNYHKHTYFTWKTRMGKTTERGRDSTISMAITVGGSLVY